MSLTARTMKVTYTAAGGTTFAMPDVPILDDSVEVIVYTRDESTTPTTVALQSEGALNDYTLTGAPDASSFHTNVEFNSAPTSGFKVVIHLELPITQVLDYNNNNSAGVRPTQLEEALDRAIGMIQQLEEQLSRVPKMGITEQSTAADLILPDPASGVEGLFAWSTSGAIRLYTLAEALAGAAATSVADAGYAAETIIASAEITSVTDVWTQYRPLVGSPGAVSASTTPFGTSAGWDNGTQMLLRGTHATNTVQITHNDAAGGAILNGNAVLGANDMLTLIYDSNDDRWIEVARNF